MKVKTLSVNEIIEHINQKEFFEAILPDKSLKIKIGKYVPYCCTAIHNGNKLRAELTKKIYLSDYQRWHEEDPLTGSFIASMPITIIANDSKFEYDLNRKPEECVYSNTSENKIWKRSLTKQEVKVSTQKHANYFIILHAIIAKLEELFNGCIVYDIHSYNYKNADKETALFNIGTKNINLSRYKKVIDNWSEELNTMKIQDIKVDVTQNDVFTGSGYNPEYIAENFENTLVLTTFIKKIYCDELTSDVYPKIVRLLQQRLKKAILNNTNHFGKQLENWHYIATPKLLEKSISDELLYADQSLFSLLYNFELLAAVNPKNTRVEKRKFFKNKYTELPTFKYEPVKINPYRLKQKLLSIPLQKIQDISIRNLYEAVVNSYFDKIDMIGSLNTNKFLYNSLRYFGRPSKKDLVNASYLLHLPEIPGEAKNEPAFDAKDAMKVFQKALDDYNISANIELNNKVISQVMVINSKQSIQFQPSAKFKRKELRALIEHEIGVHMVTTMNSISQKLKIFNLGLPVNTLTQEGLAILAEYLSGNINLKRLKKLALRVIVVDMMCSGADFIECFDALTEEYQVEENDAFNIVTRIFRGGGFTKDYLYLSGFVKIFRLWEEEQDLTPLLVGKTSLPFYNTIEEMIGREMIAPPKYITKSFVSPKAEMNSSIYNYIFSGLKY